MFPNAGDAQRRAFDIGDIETYGFSGLVRRFVKGPDRNAAELPETVGMTKTRLDRHRFGARIVGLARQLEIGPMRLHAEHAQSASPFAGQLFGARQPDHRRHIARISLGLIFGIRRRDAEMLLQLCRRGRTVIGAHEACLPPAQKENLDESWRPCTASSNFLFYSSEAVVGGSAGMKFHFIRNSIKVP